MQNSSSAEERRVGLIAALREWGDVQLLTVAFAPGNEAGIVMLTWCHDGSRLFPDAVSLEAEVVILDPRIPGYALEDVQRLYHHEKKPVVVIAALPPGPGDWQESMYRAGAKGHVQLPLTEESVRRLPGIIHTAIESALQERASPGYIPQVSPEVATAIATRGWQRASVVIWANKGGVGKSTIAENVAALLGVVANRKTALVDLNMDGGSIHIDLGIPPTKNVYSVASAYEFRGELKGGEVQTHMIPFQSQSNLWLLLGLPKQSMGGQTCFKREGGEQGKRFANALLDVLRETFDFVVIEIGQNLNDPVHLAAIRAADLVLVVVTPVQSAILRTREVLEDLFDKIQLDRTRFRLVVNAWHPDSGLARKEIVQIMGLPEIGVIPSNLVLTMAALNTHRPVVLSKNSAVADGMAQVASSIFAPLAQVWNQKHRLGRKRRGLLDKMLDALGA